MKNRGRVRVGDAVAVLGCGGVGLNVVQCAAAAGGRVIAIDRDDQRLSIALSTAKLMCYELEVVGSLGCGAGLYPEIVELVRTGALKLDPIVSGTLPLEEIHTAFDRLRQGEGVRWVIVP